MFKVFNALGFQAGWWACVVGAARGLELPALAFCGVLAVAHLRHCSDPRWEALLAARVLGLGIALDSLLQATGIIAFQGFALTPLSPLWLWMLWVLFALTLNASLAFLQQWHWGLSALLGAVFGPASYMAGASLGAATVELRPGTIAPLALAWMAALPLMVLLARRRVSAD